ncbi:haloacid dehalogenase type II [Paraglaciecola sp. L3A3]|uniref:haloacid dehalogenase type II n=1 Tax=Paraglaciecola sp. L3A3 TaxID=2686358 RepID=UPI00131AF3A4|nr:haloacid dehalogenase type II [Paraglaciecola sp. L3A3]
MRNKVILFDINETVLNLKSLQPKFTEAFGSEEALSLWFSKLLHSSTVCVVTNVHTNFAKLADVMLESVAANYQLKLSESKRTELLSAFANLQAHSDIKGALSKLRENGFKTVAFSNSSLSLISSQIKNAGLTSLFDEIISVEETGSFKPNPNAYRFAAKVLAEPVENLCLVATHDWDTHGALSVGLNAAYINRSNAPYHALYLKPDIQANTMDSIVQQIIEAYL